MVTLNGESLTLEQVEAVARRGEPVELDQHASKKMRASREWIERMAAGGQPVYAVNTGVGYLADERISAEDLDRLQENVVRSHACGVGEPLPREAVRAMMLIRANVLAKGLSGIRPLIARRLCALLNHGVTPVVPSRGSVGASGDLAPLAHMALVLMGEGEAEYEGRRMSGAEALAAAGIEPVRLHAKEGISLVNGTQAMLGVGALALIDIEDLCEIADVACALSTDALRGTPRAFDARIHAARPHPGQMRSARLLERLMRASEIRESHRTCRHVQDAYSLRCAPQVHGAVRDAAAEARRVFSIELNSATDNPLVFDGEILSGGNFHGQPLALVMDWLAIALCSLAGISERRTDRMVNPMLNEGLPAFLASHPGLESGLMMWQVTAAALVAELRVLAAPASPGSITTSGNKEDFVSMGMTAALKLRQAVELARQVLAIELVAASQAIEFLRPLRTSPVLEEFLVRLRGQAPVRRGDFAGAPVIAAVSEWLRQWRELPRPWAEEEPGASG
ncbi:MAG: histidine ammonia-lyase [Bryobacteraceae bacterium]|nr:histidine ammonia-lyase [Bryobacteraceae bacterium]